MSSSESYYPFPWESDEQAPYPRKLSPDTAQVLSKLATLQLGKKARASHEILTKNANLPEN